MAREGLKGRMPKLLVGVVTVVVLGGIAVASSMQRARLKRELADKQQALVALRAQNDELQQQLMSVEAERKGLVGRLTGLRSQLASSTEELERLRSSVTELQVRYDALEDVNIHLESQVSQLTREREEASNRALRLEGEKTDLERAASRLRERLALLDRDYQHLAAKLSQLEQQEAQPNHRGVSPANQASTASGSSPSTVTTLPSPATPQTVELPPIVVRKDQAGAGLPVRARLVEVNETHRFVVIDKGANDGVRTGMTFDILRGGGTVGQTVAVRVRPQLSACDIITSRSSGSFQIGDLAIQRSP